MALLPSRLLVRLLGLCIHRLLLRDPTPHHRLRQHCTLLLLRWSCVRCLRFTNGHCWLLDCIRVREEDIRRDQGGLRFLIFANQGVMGNGQHSTGKKGRLCFVVLGLIAYDAYLARTNRRYFFTINRRSRSARLRILSLFLTAFQKSRFLASLACVQCMDCSHFYGVSDESLSFCFLGQRNVM